MADTRFGQQAGRAGNGPCKLMHLSDLHVGLFFSSALWNRLLEAVQREKPDVIVITGDLVNSPWWFRAWGLRRKLAQLDAVQRQATDGDFPALRVIPGNHDTRLSGLVPIRWIWLMALACAAMLYWTVGATQPEWTGEQLLLDTRFIESWGLLPPRITSRYAPWIVGSAMAAMLAWIATAALLWPNILHVLPRAYRLRKPEILPGARVGLLPIDSATPVASLWGARGLVRLEALQRRIAERDALQEIQPDSSVVWIGLVHHHLLPLPYDSENEALMIMDNAGSVLAELARAEIPLVLHGHKHHQNFARFHPRRDTQMGAVAILSAGTPTQKKWLDKRAHGFNIVTVSDHLAIEIEQFEARPDDGEFVMRQRFPCWSEESAAHDRYAATQHRKVLVCERLEVDVLLNDYGDASISHRFRNVQAALLHTGGSIAFEIPLVSRTGVVEFREVVELTPSGCEINLRPRRHSRHRIDLEVRIDRIKPGESVDFEFDYFVHNAHALDVWQHEQMYGPSPRQTEFFTTAMPASVGVTEMVTICRFPQDRLPEQLVLSQSDPVSGHGFQGIPDGSPIRLEDEHLYLLRVRFPVSGSIYRVEWVLPAPRVRPTLGLERDLARVQTARDVLARQQPRQIGTRYDDLLQRFRATAEELLVVHRNPGTRPVDVALYAYDRRQRVLRYALGTLAAHDPRCDVQHRFGEGAIGRAFKAAAPALHPGAASASDAVPVLSVGAADAGADETHELPREASLVALPFALADRSDMPIGVVTVSTDDSGVVLRTADSAQAPYLDAFRQAFSLPATYLEDLFPLAAAAQEAPDAPHARQQAR